VTRLGALTVLLWGAFAVRVLIDLALVHGLEPLPLAVPFGDFPMDALGAGWEGSDVPLEDAVRDRAGVSAFVLRSYRRGDRPLWFYAGYVTGAAPRSIHHPGVCFPASGLALVRGQAVRIPIPGIEEPAVFKEYVWAHLDGTKVYTLTTFHHDGVFQPEEWRLRAARLFGLRYFAVITISVAMGEGPEEARGVCEEALRRALPQLLRHFPAESNPTGET
jgi:hypothetical protein